MQHPSKWLAHISLSTSVLTLPVYVLVVTLYFRNPQLKTNVAYWLLANIGIVDCFSLVARVHESLMTVFSTSPINVILYEFSFSMLLIYSCVLDSHVFLLVLNRVATIFGLKCKHERIITKIASLLVWISALLIFCVYRIKFVHTYKYREYFYEDETEFEDSILANSAVHIRDAICDGANVLTILCHLIVIAAMLVKKLRFKVEEIQIYALSLAIFVPGLLYWAFATFMDPFTVFYTPAWRLFDILFPRLMPTMNLLICLCLNRNVRNAFIASFKPAPEINVEIEQNFIAATEEEQNVDPKSDVLAQKA